MPFWTSTDLESYRWSYRVLSIRRDGDLLEEAVFCDAE